MNRRMMVVQLVIFLVVAFGCGVYVVRNVFGPQVLHTPSRVVVHMPDAAGLAPSSQVTYRGVQVGTVSAVRIEDTGVSIELDLDASRPIPAGSKAIVSMDTPVAIQHLDFQPAEDKPPYLHDGSVIESPATARPLPLETLLVHFVQVADSLDPHDISVLADALSTGLNGMAPQLDRILDNTGTLLRTLQEQQPKVLNLINNGQTLLGSAGAATGSLPQLAASMRQLADQVRSQDPTIRTLLDNAPAVANQLVPLLANNQQAVTVLLGNLVTVGGILSTRVPALNELAVAMPDALGKVAKTVHGDTTDFYLVGTQGPVCYNGTQRRPPTDTAPRDPQLGWQCPSKTPTLDQRGAANAPRPDAPPVSAPTAVQGPRSWYSILLQGVQ